MKAAAIILNRISGRQDTSGLAVRVAELLSRDGYSVVSHETQRPGHAEDLARDASRSSDFLVVIGGDGTLREVVCGLDQETVPILGLIPTGNANVIARELGISLDPKVAIEGLISGTSLRLDAGRVNGELFLSMVGVGYDALITGWMNRIRHTKPGAAFYRIGGDFLYSLLGLLALLRIFPTRVEVLVDDHPVHRQVATALVCNTENYAKGWSATPGASSFDGVFDVMAGRFTWPVPVVFWVLCLVLRTRAPMKSALYLSGKKITISSADRFSWQLDGDPRGKTHTLEIEVLPGHVNIICPAKVEAT